MALDSMTVSFTVGEVVDTAILYGQVLSMTDTPMPSVKVEVLDKDTFTNSEGNYQIEDIPVGIHTVTFSRNKALQRKEEVNLVTGENRLDVRLYPATRTFFILRMDYAIKPSLRATFKPTEIRGIQAITHMNDVKVGMGGTELEVETKTLRARPLWPEATHWHKTYQDEVGLVIYDDNLGGANVFAEYETVSLGPEYSYILSVSGGTIREVVRDSSGGVVLDLSYHSDAQYFSFLRIPLEYYWYPEEGTFSFRAYHIIEGLYSPAMGWKSAKECLMLPTHLDIWDTTGYLHSVHSIDGDSYRVDMEIIDEGMI